MHHYLVTGGAGFIGSNLVAYLTERGEAVRVLDNFSTGRRENLAGLEGKVDIVEGDICVPDDCARAVADVDIVLHQAALPSVPRSVVDPLRTHAANATGTLQLLMAARAARVKRFVYAGSSSAYGNQSAAFKREDQRPRPLSPYAASKLAGEHYVAAFAECYGMETVSLRYFNVFGPRQDPDSPYSAVVPLFIVAALEGHRPTIHGDGGQSRDFTYVENNVWANVLAATGRFDARGQVINVACGVSYSLRDLVEGIGAALGRRIDPVMAPARIGEVRDSRADISCARETLGYEVRVPFQEGLRRTIEWYARRHGEGAGRESAVVPL
ncbi:MAG TPA: SDR family oxidoreductase [Candidatus Hydrogenedentes bacterium]|nr:SDR family oxidoreductase [Candidatus Hydrogenedentota bacterium]HOS02716.1 SDR family oxidoreductase [Candidatus Hydrogenedentota bacterium]